MCLGVCVYAMCCVCVCDLLCLCVCLFACVGACLHAQSCTRAHARACELYSWGLQQLVCCIDVLPSVLLTHVSCFHCFV
jgi:hypothetical protein